MLYVAIRNTTYNTKPAIFNFIHPRKKIRLNVLKKGLKETPSPPTKNSISLDAPGSQNLLNISTGPHNFV